MSVATCDLYKIVFKFDLADTAVRRLATWGKFEPVSPSSPIDDKTHKKLSVEVQKRKDDFRYVIEFYEKEYLHDREEVVDQTEIDRVFQKTLENYSVSEKQFEKFVLLVDELKKEKGRLSRFEEKTQDLRFLLEKVDSLDFPIFSTHELFDIKLFFVPAESVSELEIEIQKNKKVYAFPLEGNSEGSYYIFLLPKNRRHDILEKLTQELLSHEIEIDKSLSSYTPLKLKEIIGEKYLDLKQSLENTEKKAMSMFLSYETAFKCVVDILSFEGQTAGLYKYLSHYTGSVRDREVENSSILKKGKLYQIEGWVSPFYKVELMRMFEFDRSIEIIEVEALSSEQVRTILINNSYVRPFESITKLMGMPSPNEIDPTPFLSPFFILFFGFALGDGGYGLIMLAVTSYLLFKKKLVDDLRQGVILMFFCGLSTIFFGAITGSWFGAEITALGGPLGEFLLSLKQFDLKSSIMLVLAASIGIGFIHQIFGLVLHSAVYIKNKQYLEAFSGPGTWILLLLSLTAKFGFGIIDTNLDLQGFFDILLIVSFGVFVIGQGIKTRPVYLIPLVGIAQLFNITSFLSNSLSYARLLALGLATSVIASVINLLAGLFGGTDSIFGIIVLVSVLILGHTINIALNLLGTFINVLRLQLVEFFPRFFNAQGVELDPVKLDKSYFDHEKGFINNYADKFSYLTLSNTKR